MCHIHSLAALGVGVLEVGKVGVPVWLGVGLTAGTGAGAGCASRQRMVSSSSEAHSATDVR